MQKEINTSIVNDSFENCLPWLRGLQKHFGARSYFDLDIAITLLFYDWMVPSNLGDACSHRTLRRNHHLVSPAEHRISLSCRSVVCENVKLILASTKDFYQYLWLLMQFVSHSCGVESIAWSHHSVYKKSLRDICFENTSHDNKLL